MNTILYTFGNPGSLRLTADAILAAVDRFAAGIEKDGVTIGGYLPAAVAIHPWLLDPNKALPEFRIKYKALAKELAPALETLRARGIAVKADAGVLSWEIAIIADHRKTGDSFYTPHRQIEDLQHPPICEEGVISRGGVLVHPAHRPRLFGEDIDSLIATLASEGLGGKAIHKQLVNQGIRLSLSTVSKRLQVMKRAVTGTHV